MSHIFVITGTSGGGKDSIVRALLQQDSNLYRVVTHTSRPKRTEEIEDVDYHFVTPTEFEEMIQSQQFVEWALVYEQYKGISKSEIAKGLTSNKDVILRINIDGVQTIKKLYPQAISIFITAPDEEELQNRLKNRATDNESDQNIRIQEISREHAFADHCDYIVYNHANQFENTLYEVKKIILNHRNSHLAI